MEGVGVVGRVGEKIEEREERRKGECVRYVKEVSG